MNFRRSRAMFFIFVQRHSRPARVSINNRLAIFESLMIIWIRWNSGSQTFNRALITRSPFYHITHAVHNNTVATLEIRNRGLTESRDNSFTTVWAPLLQLSGLKYDVARLTPLQLYYTSPLLRGAASHILGLPLFSLHTLFYHSYTVRSDRRGSNRCWWDHQAVAIYTPRRKPAIRHRERRTSAGESASLLHDVNVSVLRRGDCAGRSRNELRSNYN